MTGETIYVRTHQTLSDMRSRVWGAQFLIILTIFSPFKERVPSIELAQKQSQTSLRQKGKASIPHWETTDNRRQNTNLHRNGELAPCGLYTADSIGGSKISYSRKLFVVFLSFYRKMPQLYFQSTITKVTLHGLAVVTDGVSSDVCATLYGPNY
jgi:hypothetical protein